MCIVRSFSQDKQLKLGKLVSLNKKNSPAKTRDPRVPLCSGGTQRANIAFSAGNVGP